MKQIISKIHFWLGLICAPVLIFVCLTGSVIVFADEIMNISAGDAKYVPEVKASKIPTEQLLKKLNGKFPKRKKPYYIVTYKDSTRSVRCNMYSKKKGLRMVYVDPYTGEVLKDDGTINFFYITAHLHNSLMLRKTGEWIIDISVLIFLILIISGIILWWPKSWQKKHRNAAFKIKLNATWKRLNRDLHIVLGFYASAVLLVLCTTGLIIAFKPFSAFTQNTFGGDPDHSWKKELPKLNSLAPQSYPLNDAIYDALKKHPEKDELQVYTYLLDKEGYYSFTASDHIGLKSAYSPEYNIINRYSGKEINLPDKAIKTERIENMFWSIHMGTYWGIIGKIIVFLGGLIGTSLPVTGIYIWWNRIRNRKTFKV